MYVSMYFYYIPLLFFSQYFFMLEKLFFNTAYDKMSVDGGPFQISPVHRLYITLPEIWIFVSSGSLFIYLTGFLLYGFFLQIFFVLYGSVLCPRIFLHNFRITIFIDMNYHPHFAKMEMISTPQE